ncbi:MAG: hypothetical protein JRD69_03635 [Deltaproteobacteria bacterium]|nr:hypothetical protein [Deltaproteobacteria bacterium]
MFCGKRPSAFPWRSQGGLEVDLIIQAKGKLWPIEIKLTSTPSFNHVKGLNRFKEIAGGDASQQGIIVCRIDKTRNLPGENIAVPWSVFPEWLREIID